MLRFGHDAGRHGSGMRTRSSRICTVQRNTATPANLRGNGRTFSCDLLYWLMRMPVQDHIHHGWRPSLGVLQSTAVTSAEQTEARGRPSP